MALIAFAVVYVALWPWFILAALRKMATAQQSLANSVKNGDGHKDVGESLDALQYQMGRIATAMERISLGEDAAPLPPPRPAPRDPPGETPQPSVQEPILVAEPANEPMTPLQKQVLAGMGILTAAGLVAWWVLTAF